MTVRLTVSRTSTVPVADAGASAALEEPVASTTAVAARRAKQLTLTATLRRAPGPFAG